MGDSGGDGVGIKWFSKKTYKVVHLVKHSIHHMLVVQMLLFGSSSKATLSDSSGTGLSSFWIYKL